MDDRAAKDYFKTLRESYTRAGLDERDAAADPFEQFGHWMQDAVASGLREPNAMTLATVREDGSPDARIVLLKDASPAGFAFFTNHESAKGQQLAGRAEAALVFFWADLERQIRIAGVCARLSREESQHYFDTRPRGSQLGAWASRQSEVVSGREVLERQMAECVNQYDGQDVPLPPHWGGYRLAPRAIEFWQGRPNRLHDRLRYRKNENNEWILERLSP